jgi:hypothetical protein
MAIVTNMREAGIGPTPEQMDELKRAATRPITAEREAVAPVIEDDLTAEEIALLETENYRKNLSKINNKVQRFHKGGMGKAFAEYREQRQILVPAPTYAKTVKKIDRAYRNGLKRISNSVVSAADKEMLEKDLRRTWDNLKKALEDIGIDRNEIDAPPDTPVTPPPAASEALDTPDKQQSIIKAAIAELMKTCVTTLHDKEGGMIYIMTKPVRKVWDELDRLREDGTIGDIGDTAHFIITNLKIENTKGHYISSPKGAVEIAKRRRAGLTPRQNNTK